MVHKKKNGEITEEEAVELERYLSLDLFINLAKARAKRLLAAGFITVNEGEIISITRTGEATVKLLRFNEPERLIIRKILMLAGSYP